MILKDSKEPHVFRRGRMSEDLRAQKKALEAKIAEAEKRELEAAQKKVEEKINSFSDEEKQFLLSLINHDRSSCDDDNIWNGWDGERFRCSKCMLIEILNGQHGGEFDFSISVDIHRVSV